MSYKCIFSGSAVDEYDKLRHISTDTINDIIEIIISAATNKKHDIVKIVDAGVGTGRIMLPLQHRLEKNEIKYKLIGIDISEEMICEFKRKTRHNRDKVNTYISDLNGEMPKEIKNMGVVYTLATVHIIKNWRSMVDNIRKSLVNNGVFIIFKEINQFMHQTEGFDSDYELIEVDDKLKRFMKHYHTLRKKYNCSYIKHEIRYSNMDKLYEYCENNGFKRLNIKNKKILWMKPHSYYDILNCFEKKQMTTFGSEIDDKSRKMISDELKLWLKKHNYDIYKTFTLKAQIVPNIFVKYKI